MRVVSRITRVHAPLRVGDTSPTSRLRATQTDVEMQNCTSLGTDSADAVNKVDASEMEAENVLVADLVRMARAVQADLGAGASPVVWKERRGQIAALRQRVRDMSARHLGGRPTQAGRAEH